MHEERTVTTRIANLWWIFKRCHDVVDITVVACWRFYIHHSYCKCFDLKCTNKITSNKPVPTAMLKHCLV